MKYVQIAHEISLASTLPTIWLSGMVLLIWRKEFFRIVLKHKTAASWMLIGVFFSFLGGVGDNLYWGIAWFHSYVGSAEKEWWFEHGVFSNILFRQTAGTLAAYCHVRSAAEFAVDKGLLLKPSANKHLFYSSVIGVILLISFRFLS